MKNHYKIKCPICNNPLEYKEIRGNWGIEESSENCKICGFYNFYAYGASITVVGDKYFITGYTTKDNNPIFKKMKRTYFTARRRWRKYHKGVTCKDCPI